MNQYFFLPASEGDPTVYGAECPGHRKKFDQASVEQWISFMRRHGIGAVVCLLPPKQLALYAGLNGSLLDFYEKAFGPTNVLHEPVREMHYCSVEAMLRILTFLQNAYVSGQHVVVHCLAGYGRTGHVLAAWLVYNYGLSSNDAIARMEAQGREPFEAVYDGSEEKETLLNLLYKAIEWRVKG